MTRPIKFRIRYREGWAPFKEDVQYLTLEEISRGPVIFTHAHIEILSIDQSTGLTDTNGKDVYEGDIVKRGNQFAEVCWNDTAACFSEVPNFEGFYKSAAKRYEVIGNIYENPELLNV